MTGHVLQRNLYQGKDPGGARLEVGKLLRTSRSRRLWAHLKEGKGEIVKIGVRWVRVWDGGRLAGYSDEGLGWGRKMIGMWMVS